MNTAQTGNGNPSSNQPTHEVYLVGEGQGDKAHWKRIGAAWPHKDNKGFNVTLDGRIVFRERKPKEKAADASPDALAASEVGSPL